MPIPDNNLIMQIQVDTDLVLESLLNRDIYSDVSRTAYQVISLEQVKGYITNTGLKKIYRIIRNSNDNKIAREIIYEVKKVLTEIPINPSILDKARLLNISDLESAIEVACAINYGFGAILTLCPNNFAGAELPILLPENILNRKDLEQSLLLSNGKYFLQEFSDSNERTSLTQWLEGEISEGWQPLESLIKPKIVSFRSAPASTRGLKLAKKIQSDSSEFLVLVIRIFTYKINKTLGILVQVYASDSLHYLPKDTTLTILDGKNNIFIETTPRENDIGLQLRFRVDFQDKFSIQIQSMGQIFLEKFIA